MAVTVRHPEEKKQVSTRLQEATFPLFNSDKVQSELEDTTDVARLIVKLSGSVSADFYKCAERCKKNVAEQYSAAAEINFTEP